MSRATTSITTKVNRLRTRSETVRPMSTPGWNMGRERRRSMMPLVMSSAIPIPVNADPNRTVWANTPGIRYWV